VSYTGTDAWGQGRSGFSAMRGETALGEPGTKHEMWLCTCLGKFCVTVTGNKDVEAADLEASKTKTEGLKAES